MTAAVPAVGEAAERGEKSVYVNGEKTESGDGNFTAPYNSFADALVCGNAAAQLSLQSDTANGRMREMSEARRQYRERQR